MVYKEFEGKILYRLEEKDPFRTLMLRGAFILSIIIVIIIIFWFQKSDLRDQHDGDVSFADIIYFTFITITTVGYGDIVPVTETARLIDAVVMTPLRVIIWITFLGTAYEFIIPKYMEGYRLKNLQRKLTDHTILVGYGSTGKAVAEELLNIGNKKEDIIIIDMEQERTQEAARDGFMAIRGDAANEDMLEKAVIANAKNIIVVTGKDDTNVLIVLTARHMNHKMNIVARANLDENTKLLERGGANAVVTPLVTGGRLLAASTMWKTAAKVLEDILSAKHGLMVLERNIEAHEVGKKPKSLKGIVVLAIKRGKRIMDPQEIDNVKLRTSDILICVQTINRRAMKKEPEGPDDGLGPWKE